MRRGYIILGVCWIETWQQSKQHHKLIATHNTCNVLIFLLRETSRRHLYVKVNNNNNNWLLVLL